MKLGFDPTLEKDVEKIFASMGLSPKEAIKLFYEQVKQQKTLPFFYAPANKVYKKEILEAAEDIRNRKNLQRFDSFKDFAKTIKEEAKDC